MTALAETEEAVRGDCPYVGLTAYCEEDAEFFFGRADEIDLVIANLQASRLTLLIGESGVGKSSILLAGVMRELHAEVAENVAGVAPGAVEEGDEREKAPFAIALFRRPWVDPPLPLVMGRIRAAVEQAAGHAVPPWTPGDDVVEALRGWADAVWTILVVLDQFEEYLLYHPAEDAPDTVAGALVRAVNDPDLRVNFLLSIREDSLAKLDRFKPQIPIFGNVLRIKHLGADAARDAIEKPLERYSDLAGDDGGSGYRAEPELVAEVVDQVRTGRVHVGAGAGAATADGNGGSASSVETPLLQLVLTRLWEEERQLGSQVLRRETFVDRLRGARNIVRTQLDPTLDRLSEREKDVAADAFRHLVTPSGSKFTQNVSDLASLADVTRDVIEPVLKTLADGRILRPISPPPGEDDVRYEIFHDALGPTVLDWRRRHLEDRAREEGERRAEEAARKARRRMRIWAGVGVLSLLLAVGVGWLAWDADRERSEADRQRKVATAGRGASQARALLAVDPHLAIRPALVAVRTLDGVEARVRDAAGRVSVEAESVLAEALSQSRLRLSHRSGAPMNAAALSRNGRWLITGGEDGAAFLVDARTGEEHPLARGKANVAYVGFDARGRLAFTAGGGGTARVWDVQSRSLTGTVRHKGPIVGAQFSPREPVLLTAGADGAARLWDVTGKRQQAVLRGGRTLSAASFSSKGDWIATGDADGTIRLWHRPASGWKSVRPTRIVAEAHNGSVATVAFSRSGRRLITGGQGDGTAVIVDVPTGSVLHRLEDHPWSVVAARFTPDGEFVVTASEKTLRIWDAESGTKAASVRATTGWLWDVNFRPGGGLILTSGTDGVRVWELERTAAEVTPVPLFDLLGHTDSVASAAFSADGRSVVTASYDGSTRLWNVTTGLELRSHHDWVNDVDVSRDGHAYTVSAAGEVIGWDILRGRPVLETSSSDPLLWGVAVHPDNTFFVTVGGDGRARMWRTVGKQAIEFPSESFGVRNSKMSVVAVDPRRGVERAAIGALDGTVRLLTWRNGEPRVERGLPDRRVARGTAHRGSVGAIAFSPDGTRLVTAGADKKAQVWNPATGARIATFDRHNGLILGAAFHPNGRLVATASDDWTVRVWDAGSGKGIRRLGGNGGLLRAVAFNKDGRLVAAAGAGGIVYVWEWGTRRLVATMRVHADLINALVFDSDDRIITASDDYTAKANRCRTCGPPAEVRRQASERLRRVRGS
jgi:WD40 repeat protein